MDKIPSASTPCLCERQEGARRTCGLGFSYLLIDTEPAVGWNLNFTEVADLRSPQPDRDLAQAAQFSGQRALQGIFFSWDKTVFPFLRGYFAAFLISTCAPFFSVLWETALSASLLIHVLSQLRSPNLVFKSSLAKGSWWLRSFSLPFTEPFPVFSTSCRAKDNI